MGGVLDHLHNLFLGLLVFNKGDVVFHKDFGVEVEILRENVSVLLKSAFESWEVLIHQPLRNGQLLKCPFDENTVWHAVWVWLLLSVLSR